MKTAQILKAKIRSEKPTIGVITTFHVWPALVEILVKADVDYMILDLEHLTYDGEMVAQICTLGRLTGLPILIRPASCDETLMRSALDAGAVGMLIPYVETQEHLERIERAVLTPPKGARRPGGPGTFWITGYNGENWRKEVEEDLIILPQIESPLGLKNVDAIACHPLTTAIAIGPYDLSANLGVCWQPDDPKLQQAISTVREAGKKAGKNMWMIGNPDDLKKKGFTFICAAEASMLLQASLTDLVRRLKSDAPAQNSSSASEQPLP